MRRSVQGLLDEIGTGWTEQVQVVEDRCGIGRPVHRRELGAAAPTGAPPQTLESCSAKPYFGAIVGAIVGSVP